MRFTWLSNAPWTHTGYGTQTKAFVPRLEQLGHEPAIIAFYGLEGAITMMGNVPVYPKGFHPFGNDVMRAHTLTHKANVCISLMDAWVVDPSEFGDDIKWIPWYPVDSEPIPKAVLEKVTQAYKRIAMSRFGEKMTNNAGLDCYYVPHGVDTNVLKPMDKDAARERFGFPKDAYIIGMVAANKGNPSRKAFVEQIMAFAEFKKKHDDAILYLHTTAGMHGEYDGVNLPEFAQFCGLEVGKDVLFPDRYNMIFGMYKEADMAQLYSAFDVHMLVSMGEGFGIPIIEAQACGCPVITSGWTANKELCLSGRTINKEDADPFWTGVAAFQYKPRIGAIVEALENEYKYPSDRERARKMALAYDVDAVTDKYWKPVLEEIEKQLEKDAPQEKGCKHEFAKIGLWNADGTMSSPCKKCGAELVASKDGKRKIIAGGFANKHGFKFHEPDGIEYIIMRELDRDYDIPEPSKPGAVAVDIGAHVGIVSMHMAKLGYNVVAYEPNPDNYRRLRKNMKLNNVSFGAHNLAVTKDGRDVVIENDPNNSGGGNIYGDKGVIVRSDTLKNIIDVFDYIDLLKIDCEGAEYEILRNCDLTKIGAIRGEFHGPDAKKLYDEVKKVVPDTKVTFQGV